jgi:hypothetical protein
LFRLQLHIFFKIPNGFLDIFETVLTSRAVDVLECVTQAEALDSVYPLCFHHNINALELARFVMLGVIHIIRRTARLGFRNLPVPTFCTKDIVANVIAILGLVQIAMVIGATTTPTHPEFVYLIGVFNFKFFSTSHILSPLSFVWQREWVTPSLPM